MTIYFAGSIRGGRDDAAIYQQIIEILGRYGTVLTEHVGDDGLSRLGESSSNHDIFARDLGWLIQADAVVAEVTTPSLGVGFEIGVASFAQHKPVLCLFRPSDNKSLSAMIAGNPNVMNATYTIVEDLPKIFDQFFSRIKQIHN